MWRITTAHSPHLLLSQFCNSHAPFSATSFPDWNILLSVQFPNFLEGLFFIFCNSSVYSLSSGWGDQAHHAVLHMWVPQGFQDHAQPPLSCSHHPDDGNIGGFLAAAANRKDLRISTNSSLKSLSAHCTCQLWILFHAITVWLFPATQTFNHTYSYSEASRNHQHQYHYLKTTEHHSKTWKLLVCISYTTTQGKCWVRLISAQNSWEGNREKVVTSQIPLPNSDH